MTTCPGCKAVFPLRDKEDVPASTGFARYGVNSYECNAAFAELLAYEHAHGCFNKHSPQAYAVQHPPQLEIQKERNIDERLRAASRQSVWVHLFALHLMVEKNRPLTEVFKTMQLLLDTGIRLEEVPFDPPYNMGSLTVLDVLKAQSEEEHWRLMDEWNKSAWIAWGTIMTPFVALMI